MYNAQDRDIIEKMNTYGCFVEWCNSMIEFLILTKHDFERDRLLKMNMFGEVFENHDCQELTLFFLNAVTLGQTFNDDFTMIRGDESCIPVGKWQTNLETRRAQSALGRPTHL